MRWVGWASKCGTRPGRCSTFEEAMAAANETMGGATADAADTAEGKLKRLSVAVDEAKESIGSALLPVLEAAIPVVIDLGKAAGLAGIEFQQWTGKLSMRMRPSKPSKRRWVRRRTLLQMRSPSGNVGVEFGELLDELKLAPAELAKLKRATDEYPAHRSG